ncbi:probable glutamate--tRNA ligase, mitochondrial isoform X1 [Neodiprion virginianus]|uniref:probable glutamate--tRNA ligase, mitochondrial isoform X1 n=1 Tax=Neodiprion fabricii TaxID=2872261 RepID=UPI001ED91E29|nr:probable glutamate--tRNA ligase, mitochondrial isoform X1 [Neodiprion fabricii]XP_046427919.1 probable glutamate--tRNA ligase, mitochondrial isoform X1 [Neodiprion fabricii]XP_046427920.1 probable glutamate--tRNA ligase, mitochondrial isoform X1 [Neodiprion fabricii]XP_046620736.1 probable glutamate--tRNA ligase, mitochondrial isoform X1 [Neodiprion virginianus]XP_046620737.1 probable glutamate--tRNA ligase, mitochondrial isoform X1 [Neodiprion virginianus]XP_046620738.1 probable glutamate-
MQRNILRPLTNCYISSSQKRCYSKQQVRVRFAPSPTGHLHLGGLRTALYNYLFARSNNGSFILRIEDTDQTRLVPDAIKKLQDDLLWAGIIPDEDPTRGGPKGPYLQSKRLELYNEQVETLLKNGSAYRCFCTDRRLDLLRREALRLRQIPRYDNKCRHLAKEDLAEKLRREEPYCIRFKLVGNINSFDDLVYGPTSYDVAQNEGDPVIIKSDKYPTYHFANVVDDHFMEISHVLRGVEWLMSTQKHILMYRAFGWTPPLFAHLPLILNPDGSKLSKRQGDIRVENYRQSGIFPLALLNFITHAGGGFNRAHGREQRCYSYGELIKQFDLSAVNVNSCKLLPEKLLEFNKLEISQLLEEENNAKFLINKVVRLVSDAFPDRSKDGTLQLDENHVHDVLNWAKNRISKLEDLVSGELAFLWVVPPPSTSAISQSPTEYLRILEEFDRQLASKDADFFRKESLKDWLRNFADTNDIPFEKFMRLLRSVLSGLKEGPSVAEMIEILGQNATLDRVKRALS